MESDERQKKVKRGHVMIAVAASVLSDLFGNLQAMQTWDLHFLCFLRGLLWYIHYLFLNNPSCNRFTEESPFGMRNAMSHYFVTRMTFVHIKNFDSLWAKKEG